MNQVRGLSNENIFILRRAIKTIKNILNHYRPMAYKRRRYSRKSRPRKRARKSYRRKRYTRRYRKYYNLRQRRLFGRVQNPYHQRVLPSIPKTYRQPVQRIFNAPVQPPENTGYFNPYLAAAIAAGAVGYAGYRGHNWLNRNGVYDAFLADANQIDPTLDDMHNPRREQEQIQDLLDQGWDLPKSPLKSGWKKQAPPPPPPNDFDNDAYAIRQRIHDKGTQTRARELLHKLSPHKYPKTDLK